MIGGRPAIVSVKPIVSETGDIAQVPGSEYLHVSLRYLDGSFLKTLTDQKFQEMQQQQVKHQQPPRQTTPHAQPQPASGHLTPQQIERITTHESRIVPTPGGMSFAEAHKRRDEPEQISPGSLRPVGKLDTSQMDKGSRLYRMHLAQEQAHMRDLGIALAQDRERFKNEPSPQRTLQPSVERVQEQAPAAQAHASPARLAAAGRPRRLCRPGPDSLRETRD